MDEDRVGWRATLLSPQAWWRHLVWLIAATAAGGAALYFIYAERWAIEFTRAATQRSRYLPPVIVAVGLVVICRLRDRVFPGTDGTGIPQAIAALQMGDTPERGRLLSLRVGFGKLVLLTLGLFAGATLGREGPTVHVAACCLYLARRLAPFPRPLVERGLILAGGAAGIAAAFNAPIAGIVFTFEEIGRSFEKRNTGVVLRTVAVACLVCVAVLSDYLFYGEVQVRLQLREWPIVPAIGLGGGLLGGLFARAVASTTPRVRRLARRAPYMVAGSLGLMLAVLGLLSAGASYGGGDEQVRAILISGQTLPNTYPLVKAAGSFVTLISSIPAGLFTPTLSVGAGLGQLAAALVPSMNRQAIVLLAMGGIFLRRGAEPDHGRGDPVRDDRRPLHAVAAAGGDGARVRGVPPGLPRVALRVVGDELLAGAGPAAGRPRSGLAAGRTEPQCMSTLSSRPSTKKPPAVRTNVMANATYHNGQTG